MMQKNVSAFDLFCGAGGLTCGLQRGGITVRGGLDADPECRYAYETNNGAEFILADIAQVTGEMISRFYREGEIRLLAGCAPCQPFSTYTQGRTPSESSKWGLLYHFERLAEELQPDLVTMENVVNLREERVFTDFTEGLERLGYHVWYDRVVCHEHGLPQIRKRLVLLASKFGPIRFISSTRRSKPTTVRQAIGHLPPIAAGGVCPTDMLHRASVLRSKNIARMQHSKPGGTWRDWPEELLANCHRKESGKSYSGVYARMEWDAPSPTITTQCFGFGNGRFGHPEQDRAISLREAAILQTFPESYQFVPPGERVSMKTVGRLIGNAVPVRLGEIIAESVIAHLREAAAGTPAPQDILACFE